MTGEMRVGPACPTSATPCLSVTGITGSATVRSTAVAPGQLVTLFGSGIGPNTGASFMGLDTGALFPFFPPVPTSLGDTQVFFNGVAAPMLFAQANQVNAIVPFEVLQQGDTANVQISHGGQTTQTVTVSVVKKQPGIFTTGGTGSGQAVVQNADGKLNSSSNLAAKGSTISILATGAGQTIPTLPDGTFATDDFQPAAITDHRTDWRHRRRGGQSAGASRVRRRTNSGGRAHTSRCAIRSDGVVRTGGRR